MTGYMPSPAAPPSRSPGGLPLPDLIVAGLGLVTLVLAFLPWAGLSCSGLPAGEQGACPKATASGWQLPAGTAGAVLLVVAALLMAAKFIDPAAPKVPTTATLLALVGAVMIVIQFVQGIGSLLTAGSGLGNSRKIGLILALVVGILEAAAAVWSWLLASGRLAARRTPAASTGPGQAWPPIQPGQPWEQQPPRPQQPGPPDYGQPRDYPSQPQPAGYGQARDYPQQPPGGSGQPRDYPPQQPPGGYGQPRDYPTQPPAGGSAQPRDYPPQQPPGGYPGEPYPPQSGRHGSPG